MHVLMSCREKSSTFCVQSIDIGPNGNGPGKSQISKWKKNYFKLSTTIADEKGIVKNAKALLEQGGFIVE